MGSKVYIHLFPVRLATTFMTPNNKTLNTPRSSLLFKSIIALKEMFHNNDKEPQATLMQNNNKAECTVNQPKSH